MTRQSMGMFSVVLGLAFLAVLYQPAISQEDACSTPTVAVRIQKIYDEKTDKGIGSVYDELEIIDTVTNWPVWTPDEDKRAIIEAAVMEAVRKNTKRVQFIQNGTDCDYFFRYTLIPYGVGEDVIIDGIRSSPHLGFWMTSCFGTERECDRNVHWLIKCNANGTCADQDIFKAISCNVDYYMNFRDVIDRWERVRHPAPPRGPLLHLFQDRDWVSPLEGETEQRIRTQVTNCRGDLVADRERKLQLVFYPKETSRGELTPDREFNYHDLTDSRNTIGNVLSLKLIFTTGVQAIYTLQEGIEPGLDSVEIRTCGVDKEAIDTSEVKIMGLDLKANARRKEIFAMESTQIDIDFNRLDTEGGKIPIANKTVKIKVKGLVDGKVYPEGDVTTNAEGRVTLTYTAGEADEEVTFEAKYQPKGFKESVKDKARVEVIKYDRLCKITRKSSHTTDIAKTEGNTVSTMKWTEEDYITVSMTFFKNPEVGISFDPATMQMKPSRYVYTVDNYWISSSGHTGAGSSEETVGSGAYIQRHLSASSSQNGTFQDLHTSNEDARLTITVDPETGKATEVSLPFFDAVISIMSQYDCDGEKRVDGRLEPFDCSSSNQFTRDYPIQPLNSDREKCYELSGDGVKVIRGRCSEHKTSSQGSKDESYEWVIYAKE